MRACPARRAKDADEADEADEVLADACPSRPFTREMTTPPMPYARALYRCRRTAARCAYRRDGDGWIGCLWPSHRTIHIHIHLAVLAGMLSLSCWTHTRVVPTRPHGEPAVGAGPVPNPVQSLVPSPSPPTPFPFPWSRASCLSPRAIGERAGDRAGDERRATRMGFPPRPRCCSFSRYSGCV